MELSSPTTIPTPTLKLLSLKNPPNMYRGVVVVNSESGPLNSMTVLNKMIQMASFVIPSPNIKLKSLGYSSYLTIEIAATTSVQHNSELINRISMISNSNSTTSLQCQEKILPISISHR